MEELYGCFLCSKRAVRKTSCRYRGLVDGMPELSVCANMAIREGAVGLGRYWLWLLTALQAISAYGAELSSEACRDLGFSSNLLCSSCDLLGQFGLNQLDPFCRKCCQEEVQSETRKEKPTYMIIVIP
uniref:Selenoprotein F n=1 Tax=Laticauda laticaudata TaxID=8630 RepID=A0A8C5RNL2_LATLA